MNENAGEWLRVSTKGQNEESQHPDNARWISDHGYTVPEGCTYVVHGGSGRKPNKKFRQAWAQVLEDFRTGKIDVLVVWKLSRLDRKLQAMIMLAQVMELGGRVEFVKTPHANDLTTMTGRTLLHFEQELAYRDSEDKSENVIKDLAMRRANGSVVGRPAWGFRIGCAECGGPVPKGSPKCHAGIKHLYPTPEAEKYIPLIFAAIIDGQSLASIARWLDAEGVRTTTGKPWNESYIANKIIKNPTYYGERRNSGTLEVPPLVSASTWQHANEVLKARARPGRGATKHEKVLFTPVCGNPACDATLSDHDSPMYRSFGGRAPYRRAYYKCSGRGPSRKGCGAPMIPVAAVETKVENWMAAETRMHWDFEFVPGDDIADRIAKERERGADLMRAGDLDGVRESMLRIEELEQDPEEHVRPHWEPRETGLTIAQYWASLDRDGKRRYLATWDVLAYLRPHGELMTWCAGRELMAPA